MEHVEPTRINKYLSEVGFCSRRAADQLIEKGCVRINGKIPEMGTKVMPGDIVTVDNKVIGKTQEDFIYIAFNKPAGIVCTTDHIREKDNIIDFINHPKRIFPIGRLDKPSEGLIFLTNDGDIVNKILRARNNHEKEYVVTVNKPVTKEFVKKMGGGLPILDTKTLKCEVKQTGSHTFTITLTQGLNRQIRRMCEFLDYRVSRLKRVRIMNIKLDVPTGQWRYLNEDEILVIRSMVAHSVKSFDASDYE